MKFVLTLMALVIVAMTPALAVGDPLPASGTYFITNVGTDQALQPAASSVGQNVLLFDFSKGGSQKWTLDRKIDPKTQKPTNRYTIRLAGDNTELKLQPHPAIDKATIISIDGATFVLEPGEAGILLKKSNGDALYALSNPPASSEACWGPDDGSAKFRWNFVPAL